MTVTKERKIVKPWQALLMIVVGISIIFLGLMVFKAENHIILLVDGVVRCIMSCCFGTVEVGAISNAVDLVLELGNLLLELHTVSLILKGAVGGLLGQLVHAVEHVVHFGQGALGGLYQGDTVLGVVLGLVQAGDLGAHLLGDGQTRGVVAGPVDLIAGRQLLQVLGQGAGVVGVVAVGVHRHDIVLNTHKKEILSVFSGEFPLPGH